MKANHVAALLSLVSLTCLVVPAIANAQERVEVREGERRDEVTIYPVELEPHFSLGPENVYGATGIGAGLRASIPLVYGHVGELPDNLAISFGGDILHYDNCFFGRDCGANYLMLPVAAQWNVYFARRVSLFLEGGAFLYKGWFDGCSAADGPDCRAPSDFGVLPTFAIGARIRLNQNMSFVARVGYPTTTLGLSFL